MNEAALDLPPRPRVLVITLRRLGDVLLTTPLIRTLKSGLPGGSIDSLVFRGTEGMLAGNPDLDAVHVLPQHPPPRAFLAMMRRLWRRYDLAVSTQSGDRPTVLAWAAGRQRTGFIPRAGGGWKRWLLDTAIVSDDQNHRVNELLRIIDALGLAARAELVAPSAAALRGNAPAGSYAVLHVNPMFRIRQWTDAGWRELACGLAERGLTVIATGGPDPAEKAYLDRVWSADVPVVRLDGRLDWPELVTLLRGAAVYVGPDTSMSHLAAAAGAPTVALYGPESPSRIGPWPVGGLDSPWARAGTIQQRGNVWVVQNPLPCMPCGKLGCEGHLESYSRCLDELSSRQVMAAVDQALAVRHARAS